ncbi:hypothetical protein MATL_G00124310 [Megalops atlanticus]|uniref:Ig-like domain-containing protein n=1 Tax=Megalops atlanticus TaxID=7932 RepID=A0A9D3PZI2_MEGAT|nr:hypothetical protein MATL_G00124310 [Megalops atlanticus]
MRNHFIFKLLLSLTVLPPVEQPVTPVLAAPGSDVTLSCSFPQRETDSLDSVIVNWQRGDTEVVHSYYRRKDQLQRQSSAYRGRTQLFPEELSVGNASLRLRGVQGSDHGEYICAVANEMSKIQEKLLLLVAAPYDEPQLAVQTSCDIIIVTLTSSQGFPQPTVMWRDTTGSDISNESHTHIELDNRGRYTVHSELKLKLKDSQTLTVEMSLDVLKQSFSHSLTFQPLPDSF